MKHFDAAEANNDTTSAAGVKHTTAASASGGAGFNLPHGAAPSSPVNGDVWTTTAGLFVRVNGVTYGPFAAPLGATNFAATASGSVALAVNGTWYDAGCGLSLTAGTYIYTATVRTWVAMSALGGQLTGRLYNVGAATAIANSETRLVYPTATGIDFLTTNVISMLVVVPSTQTVRLEVQRTNAGTYTTATTQSDASGRTRANAVRIA